MEPSFWHKKWENNEIGFHEGRPNSLLVKHFSALELPRNSRIFLPLCGKTEDLRWLMSQGHRAVGVELNESAVESLFEGMSLRPEVTFSEGFKHYSSENLEVFVGDVFGLSGPRLGKVDAVYDRAALVALPQRVRVNYTAHLKRITSTAPQLLVTFHYLQEEMEGPPFPITSAEVSHHYGRVYRIEHLESKPVDGRLKGRVEASEEVRMLLPMRPGLSS